MLSKEPAVSSRHGREHYIPCKTHKLGVESAGLKPASLANGRVFYQLKLTTPNRQFLWPTISLKDYGSYPHRLSGVSHAGPYEQISIVYVIWQIPLSFSFLLVTGFSGPVTIVPAWFTVPGHTTSSGGWICRKSVAFYYLAAIMSRNSAVFRREDSHSPSCPGMGGTALVLLRWPLSQEAMK